MVSFIYLTGLIALFVVNVLGIEVYTHIANRDVFTDDLYQVVGSLGHFESACSSEVACVGFNSTGWLKRSLKSSEVVDGAVVWVKGSTPAILTPMPQQISAGTSVLEVAPGLTFTGDSSPEIAAAQARFSRRAFPHNRVSTLRSSSSSGLSTITVSVKDVNAPLKFGADESYKMTISVDGSVATIATMTPFGLYHALETLSQLISFNFTTAAYEINIVPLDIVDYPRFSHRGILVDTSRHFEPVDTLTAFVDSMTYAKLNVMHWHISDSQSYPAQSVAYPKLWEGSWSLLERYTQSDMAYVIEYARQRGVRVMVEIDNPGHAGSWCVGYPEVCPSPTCTQPLNPAVNATFDLLNGLFTEFVQTKGLFSDEFFHLGGDEVDTSCWTQSPSISAWLTQNNFTVDQAYFYFVKRAQDIILGLGRQPVNWEEVFNAFGTSLNKNVTIHIWLDFATLKKVVSAGYRAILSNQDNWYLDHLDTTWETMYGNEPFTGITDPAQQALVLGGEGCMWGETADTSDIFQTVWPRAAAIAERLWSDVSVNSTAEFLPRLEHFRCLLNSRSVAAAPVLNADARMAPPGPGSCFAQ